MNVKIFDFKVIGDSRGSLIAIEGQRTIPFDISRIYYIFDTKSHVQRGKHAHKDLEQILICMNGECKILLDDGLESQTLILNDLTKGLYIDSMIWRELISFSSDCILMVLASKHYDESDYIRNYEEFLKVVKVKRDINHSENTLM
ncbi:sugar 3,4-ketoisomerase [Priestia megaterium]